MAKTTHAHLVARQFGSRADAYVKSATHAQGEDLDQLAAIVSARPAGRVLDLGCGGGHVSFKVAPYATEVAAYDLSAEMLEAVSCEAARRGIANIVTRQGRVERLPFDDGTFDVVLSRFSAHHWQDFPAALREARRVVKRGGVAAFVDVISPGRPILDTWLQSIELLRDPSHVRNYSCDEWRRDVAAAGFTPGATAERRLRLEFTSWVERMGTPDIHREAIRSLQSRMPTEVSNYLALEADGSFTLDAMTLEAVAT
ncbi:MAG TPA: class I SAM-dependent methyltransferase [Alphaproteobacteria bacterium]|nr:class I SAM-dependent methyltransferase [Alphaproteobacteria bacterium]